MQPEFIQMQSETSELWWRVPLALVLTVSGLMLFGLAVGSISAKTDPSPVKPSATGELGNILRMIWCHVAHRKFHRDTGARFADCSAIKCTRCGGGFLGSIRAVCEFSTKDHPNKKHL